VKIDKKKFYFKASVELPTYTKKLIFWKWQDTSDLSSVWILPDLTVSQLLFLLGSNFRVFRRLHSNKKPEGRNHIEELVVDGVIQYKPTKPTFPKLIS